MKLKNIQMEDMLVSLRPLLERTDKIGYIAARNARKFKDALVEYFQIKNNLIEKYGEFDSGSLTKAIFPSSENYAKFKDEFNEIAEIEQDVNIMTLKFDDVVGILSGNDILNVDWMLVD